jgi:hypothetical protein
MWPVASERSRPLLYFSHRHLAGAVGFPALRGFRNRRDAHAAAGAELGGLVVLTAPSGSWRYLCARHADR